MKIKFFIIGLFLFPLLLAADGVLKVMNLPFTYLPLKSVTVTARTEYQVAETITRQTFINNTGMSVKLKYGFPLDHKATVTRVRWLIDGIWHDGKIYERPQDTTAVNPGGLQDRQFLDYMGDNPFYLSFRDSLANNQPILIELTYIELLEFDSRQIYYRYPLDLKHLINNKLDYFRISMTLTSSLPVLNPSCPSHPGCQIFSTASETNIDYETTQILPDKDFILKYGTENDSLNLVLFSHFPEPDSGYFLMLLEPPVTENPASQDPVAALFVLDISGSMAGIKFDQAQSIINKALICLLPNDYLNITAFNEEVKSFRTEPVLNTPSNASAAQFFLNTLDGTGKTELSAALNHTLIQTIPASVRPLIILITDGQIEGKLGQIINQRNFPIFILGVGQTIDRVLLTKIAQENDGFVEIPRKDNFYRCIESFFTKICHPFLSDIDLVFEPTIPQEIYPTSFSNLFAGEQLAIAGRHYSNLKLDITLNGSKNNQSKSWRFDKTLEGDSIKYAFVPKLWAKMKIENLLMQLHDFELNTAEAKKIINKIVYLGLKYGIVTPYTSYIDAGGITDVGADDFYFQTPNLPLIPEECQLEQNFPNPFNSETNIKFTILRYMNVRYAQLTIYNLLGEKIINFLIPINGIGNYQSKWNGMNENGQPVPTGVYFYQLQIGKLIWQRKMLVLK